MAFYFKTRLLEGIWFWLKAQTLEPQHRGLNLALQLTRWETSGQEVHLHFQLLFLFLLSLHKYSSKQFPV